MRDRLPMRWSQRGMRARGGPARPEHRRTARALATWCCASCPSSTTVDDVVAGTRTIPVLLSLPDDDLPPVLQSTQWLDLRFHWPKPGSPELSVLARWLDEPGEVMKRLGVVPSYRAFVLPDDVRRLHDGLVVSVTSLRHGRVDRCRGQHWSLDRRPRGSGDRRSGDPAHSDTHPDPTVRLVPPGDGGARGRGGGGAHRDAAAVVAGRAPAGGRVADITPTRSHSGYPECRTPPPRTTRRRNVSCARSRTFGTAVRIAALDAVGRTFRKERRERRHRPGARRPALVRRMSGRAVIGTAVEVSDEADIVSS